MKCAPFTDTFVDRGVHDFSFIIYFIYLKMFIVSIPKQNKKNQVYLRFHDT